MKIYEFLVRGTIEGTISGAHVIFFNDDGSLQNAQEVPLRGTALDLDAILPELLQAQQNTINKLNAEIEMLKTQQTAKSEDWSMLATELQSGSFFTWLTECMQIEPACIDTISMLRTAVNQGKVEETKTMFSLLAEIKLPTVDHLKDWQAVLDKHQIKSLRFYPYP